jgi:urease accessory protein UreF
MKSKEQSVRAASPEADAARSPAENLLGELSALLRQIGSPEFSPNSAAPFWAAAVDDLPALNHFLEDYLNRILLPCELPAILEACEHARRGEWRELLAQDLRLAEAMQPTPFAEPSRRMGRLQLTRLRPLRDERTVQRYLAAVESGQAHGWHTLVYGVTLAVYSLPLRPGLLYYTQETLSALAAAAGRSKNFGELELAEMLSGLLARAPEAVEAALLRGGRVSRVSMAGDKVG